MAALAIVHRRQPDAARAATSIAVAGCPKDEAVEWMTLVSTLSGTVLSVVSALTVDAVRVCREQTSCSYRDRRRHPTSRHGRLRHACRPLGPP